MSDFLGANSPAAQLYNVKSIPTNFLIDRNGDLVGRNLFGKELENQSLPQRPKATFDKAAQEAEIAGRKADLRLVLDRTEPGQVPVKLV